MRNSKNILIMFLVLCISFGIFWGLDFMLYPCTFIRNDLHRVCTTQVDDLYLGTSHGKMNIDPDVVEEVTGRSGHNLCVGGEYSIDAYYMTKLLIEKGKQPSRVIYEVSPGYFTLEKEEGNNYLLFYHEFPFSKTKIEYFMDAVAKCNFRTMLFPWYEYPLSYELKNMGDTIQKKISADYSVESLKSESQEYHENGFIERFPVDSEGFTMAGVHEFIEEELKEESLAYLEKLITLCKDHGIEFVAITAPVPKKTLQTYSDGYKAAGKYFEAYFKEQDVRYINFNSKAYYNMVTHSTEDFTDYDGHMNGAAAREFSKTLGELLME